MTMQPDITTNLYLEDSYLLGITVRGKLLRLHVLFALTADHPAYLPPIQGEQHCYREGEFRWDDVVVVGSHGQPHAVLMADPDGSLDLGSVEYTVAGGVHHIRTEWFDIRFTARNEEAVLIS